MICTMAVYNGELVKFCYKDEVNDVFNESDVNVSLDSEVGPKFGKHSARIGKADFEKV